MNERVTLATTGLSSAPALEYPFQAPRPDGSVVEVAPGVLWARMGMPLALNHINVWLLRGDDGWTIVDTGLAIDETRALWERIVAEHLDGAPVRAVVCTHFHYDHAGLASWMTERFGVPLYMSLGEFLMMRMFSDTSVTTPQPEDRQFIARSGMPEERAARLFDALQRDPFLPPRLARFRRLRGGDVLTIGPRRWKVIIGEGHSPEHVCLYSAQDRLLIGGDQLLPRITSNVMVNAFEPDGNPLAQWFDSLDRLERCAHDTLVLPSHQGVFRGLHLRVRQLREHHRQQLEEVLRIVGRDGDSTAYDVMLALYPRLHDPEQDLLALGETAAHLAWLCDRGALERRLEKGDTFRYKVTQAAGEEDTHW
ncbi:MAG: MBL fold metallo-hydrolase [Steroidobacteraceae bacterium]|nr:Hydroxyacylglutathione hydrolase [Steroidobacteraceae bacterium]